VRCSRRPGARTPSEIRRAFRAIIEESAGPSFGTRSALGTGPTAKAPHRRVSDFDWLKGQLVKILDWGDDASQASPDVFHEYGIHTALKLAALNHALDVFTPIAGGQSKDGRKYGRSVYIDLFAGCGVTRTDKGDWLAGSPILAAHAKIPFDEVILVEQAEGRFEVLRQRISRIPRDRVPRPILLRGNCNHLKGEIARLLRPNDLAFVCVDPEGTEVHWDTLQEIVNACPASDLFINFTDGVDRILAVAQMDGRGTSRLEQFTGQRLSELLAGLGQETTVLPLYERNLESDLAKPLGAASAIKDVEGRALYHLLIRTRRTSRGSPYWRGYEDLANRLQGVTASQAAQAIDILKGRQKEL